RRASYPRSAVWSGPRRYDRQRQAPPRPAERSHLMSLHRMFDAAYPPQRPYPGCQAVAGYIGGNTPHVWTRDEWRRFGGLVQFPIWTGYAEADPAGHGQQCAALMHDLGWRPGA